MRDVGEVQKAEEVDGAHGVEGLEAGEKDDAVFQRVSVGRRHDD